MSQLAALPVLFQTDWQASLGLTPEIARSPLPVLLIGKYRDQAELLAARIHALSPQSQSPFIKSRCGLFPAAQLEQRFFGRDMAHARAKFRRTTPEPGHL